LIPRCVRGAGDLFKGDLQNQIMGTDVGQTRSAGVGAGLGGFEATTNFVCELISTRESFQLTKGKSFRRTQGYAADLRYEADRRDFPQKRVGESITLSGAVYKIVAIEKEELVVSAPNSVRTTVAR